MKELKINAPKGYKIDEEKSTFENIVFKEVSKLPSSWEELNVVSGYYVDSISDIWARYENFPYSFRKKNTFKTKEQANASIALAQLSQLRDVYRQGWVPDWNNSRKGHYCIIFNGNKILTIACHYQNHFLSFQDRETVELFLENFRSLIEQAKPLMS